MRILNFIDGKHVEPVDGVYIDNMCPANGEKIGDIADSNGKDVEIAVKAALAAFPQWSALSASARSAFLLKIADIVERRLDEFAEAESRDQGKPIWLAKSVDIPRVVHNFRFFATAILHHEDMCCHLDERTMSYTISQPTGVAGLISPWNLPLYLLTWKIAPCIATGNTCVCKPSEFTSLTAHMLCDVFNEAGLPKGVVNMVMGRGASAGAALVQHKKVPLISFTGGTATAVNIIRDAAPMFKKLSLELGGKNPNIIFDDCDLELCLETTKLSSFQNQGEICLCGSRIFVQRALYDRFVARFVELCRKITVGDPRVPGNFMGAVASAQHLDKIKHYAALAQHEGGKIELGGRVPNIPGFEKGYWFEPTIITGLAPTCRTMQEEIFGPVVTISPFDTEEEVIAMANEIQYGLSASVWTASLVWVNCWLVRDLRMPFGGVKASGVGREGGKFSIEFFTEQKTICVRTPQ